MLSAARNGRLCLLATAIFVADTALAAGNKLPFEGNFELEISRHPEPAPRAAADYDSRYSAAISLQRSVDMRAAGLVDIELFGRYDEHDVERSHFDIRQLLWTVPFSDFEFQAGIGRVFWGVTESRNIVDVINQTDLIEQTDGERKLGQSMVKFAWYNSIADMEIYWLPRFRETTLPGEFGRPATPFRYELIDIQYESAKEKNHRDLAARIATQLGDFDIAFSWFKGTNRDPRFVPCFERGSNWLGTENGPQCDIDAAVPPGNALEQILINSGLFDDQVEAQTEALRQQALQDIVLVPHYDQIQQFGAELQWILGDWALKAELREREQLNSKLFASVAGLEYNWANTFGLPVDTRLALEHLHEDKHPELSSLFENSIAFGLRMDAQNTAGTVVELGAIYGIDNYSMIYQGSISGRTSENTKLELNAQVISHVDHLPALSQQRFIENEDIIRLRLFYYF